MATTNGTPWLTQAAYDRLKNELDQISGPYRQEIVDRIEAARDKGDLRENAGYHAAREEQSKNESRIQKLKSLLENAEIGESAVDDGIVKHGKLIECKLAGNDMKFVLGSREIAGDGNTEVYSVASPLGAAIEGHKAGDTVSYKAPNGNEIQVELVSVTSYDA